MKQILKQVVGIDVAQNELVVCLGRMTKALSPELYAGKAFPNTLKSFELFETWVKKMADPDTEVHYVMEATGIYHEKLVYYLSNKGFKVSVVVPNKISNYFRTLEVKTITDKTASEAIARFGLERNLEDWVPPKPIFKNLRQLTRERDQLIQERTVIKNQLHAERSEAEPNNSSIARMKDRIVLLIKQEQEIKAEIQTIVKQDSGLTDTVKTICTIPGIGVLTAITVLAETNGFELIRNKRQLISYAGLDVREKQSGTSVKGKARISKKGNKYLRKAMHLPALTSIRCDDHFKAIFARLVSKHGIKMKAAVAVQRKLLELIYTLYKTKTMYEKEYLSKKIESSQKQLSIQADL